MTLSYPPLHILRQGLLPRHGLPGDGVEEGEPGGVEGGPGDQAVSLRAVEKVPGEGVADVGHVHPDLVGAASVQLQLHQGPAPAGAEHPVAGDGRLSRRIHPTGDEGAGRPAQGGVDHPLRRLGHPVAHRQVHPAEVRRVELALEPLLGVGVLGHHHQAGGAPIQPLHRVDVGGDAPLPVVVRDKIAQGVGVVAGAGVDGDAGGLVEHQQIPVLIHDIQGTGRGHHDPLVVGVGHPDGEHLPRRCPLPGDGPDTVQQDAVLQPLDTPDHRARQVQLPPQQGVDFLPRHGRRDGERQPPGRLLRHARSPLPLFSQYTTACTAFQTPDFVV